MTIDWTKPIELIDGTPLKLSENGFPNEGANPDRDGDYWFEREDGLAFDVSPYEGFAKFCSGPDGYSGGKLLVRNRTAPEFDPAAWLEQGRRHADQLPEGVVLPEPPEFDYEPYRAALQEFYDVRELYMEVSTPFDSLDKRWADALIAAYKLFPAPTSTDWIEWRGGSCPEHLREARIAIQWREADPDGSQSSEIRLGKAWDWSHTGSEGDIVRYRVVKP